MPSPSEERQKRHDTKTIHSIVISQYKDALRDEIVFVIDNLRKTYPEMHNVFNQLDKQLADRKRKELDNEYADK